MLEEEEDLEEDLEEEGGEDVDGRLIDLEDLSGSNHPCLEDGEFSVFHCPRVARLVFKRDMEYSVDMDGLVVLSR